MAEKGTPSPITRPLSKAYLREFTGWSTAYPPGLSDPTTLRKMENVLITREGAAAVRPALRSILEADTFIDTSYGGTLVGSFEPFFHEVAPGDVRRVLLCAMRGDYGGAERVGFKVLIDGPDGFTVHDMSEVFDDPDSASTVDMAFSANTTYVKYLQIDNKIFAMSNAGETMRMFRVGDDKEAVKLAEIERPVYENKDKLTVIQPAGSWIALDDKNAIPTATTAGTNSLISSDSSLNVYNFAYFYTFENEIGETMASMIRVVKAQRAWGAWDVDVSDDAKSPDQLVAIIPSTDGGSDPDWESPWSAAVAAGAVKWNLYMLTWSNQDSVPVEALLIGSKPVTADPAINSWIAHTPLVESKEITRTLPVDGETNYSMPPTAGNGLVAGDRMVVAYDPNSQAVIRWTSSLQGSYTDFSSSKGGGYKTLTSGNMFIPAAVKLWQNPSSVDTITVLCQGVDGYSTSYYMNPFSAVNGGSDATLIMGFEETTATPGTVSPYGCEVLNNALYHPLDWGLMKSTASNYNISHKLMTDNIRNRWETLAPKGTIISSQLGNKLYFIVTNPNGEALADGCNGNEIWICDVEPDGGVWSRFLIQAVSLHKIEIDGFLYMAVVKPDGVYVLDDKKTHDDVNDGGVTAQQAIPWYLETNAQGANRAHDAWCHLQQLHMTFGNFEGRMRYGIIGINRHDKPVNKSKIYYDARSQAGEDPNDIEDQLLIKEDMKEWRFYAGSTGEEDAYTFGQISSIQYRYTPVSVNIKGYNGSVETFEYSRSLVNHDGGNTIAGVPLPLDTARP